jgi:ubiquinone/menaquinone biosynthesis C-methylase UbiE
MGEIRGREALEIGCGDGRLSGMLQSLQPVRLTAVDPDPAAIERARAAHPEIEFRTANGQALPYREAEFDTVIFTFSLHHQDAATALEEAHRVLRPGGAVVVLEPSGDGQYDELVELFHLEIEPLREARRATSAAALNCEREEWFETEWEFADWGELTASFFGYYERDYEEAIARRMAEILGPAAQQRPIIVRDRLMLQLLRRS